ncbi:hypothetical protein Plhal304r1_c012g0045841 [Plasmopara halstedii]
MPLLLRVLVDTRWAISYTITMLFIVLRAWDHRHLSSSRRPLSVDKKSLAPDNARFHRDSNLFITHSVLEVEKTLYSPK